MILAVIGSLLCGICVGLAIGLLYVGTREEWHVGKDQARVNARLSKIVRGGKWGGLRLVA